MTLDSAPAIRSLLAHLKTQPATDGVAPTGITVMVVWSSSQKLTRLRDHVLEGLHEFAAGTGQHVDSYVLAAFGDALSNAAESAPNLRRRARQVGAPTIGLVVIGIACFVAWVATR
jgi:Asp/Glu/hydantoin racemase